MSQARQVYGLDHAGDWDVPEAEPDAAAASVPTAAAVEQPDLGADFDRNWAHVAQIANLEKTVSFQEAADAIAYDMLNAATASMLAICARVADQAAAAVHDADHAGRASTSDDANQLPQKSVMQVSMRSIGIAICRIIWTGSLS